MKNMDSCYISNWDLQKQLKEKKIICVIALMVIFRHAAHYSWNCWKTPRILKFSSRAVEKLLEKQMISLNSWKTVKFYGKVLNCSID